MASHRTFQEVLAARLSRRSFLKGGVAATLSAGVPILTGAQLAGCAAEVASGGPSASVMPSSNALRFAPLPPSSDDALRIAPGYSAQVLYRWGDPVGSSGGMPAFRMDAANSATEQALQAGMHHDGMQFYSLPLRAGGTAGSSSRGLLTMNHEYVDEQLLFADGTRTYSAEKVRKSQHAVGVSVIEIERDGEGWRVVRPSRYARRIHANTAIRIGGPAAGSALMRTAADPGGTEVFGTFGGCAHGWTPWGTYLTCEENFQYAFYYKGKNTPEQARYLLPQKPRYRWFEHDERFDVGKHPNEFHRFGWVVEIDPFDPQSRPVKRTALGRFSHEGAAPSVGFDRRIAFYMGDDQPFEYIYKFVTRDAWNPQNRAANRDLLDSGTLYAARFDADGSGVWLPLVFGQGPLTPEQGFRDQADVVVKARLAAEALGATRMDRPEWCAVHPLTGEVYCTLTNNSARGGDGRPSADAANPRVRNIYGHIIRWRETGGTAGGPNVAAARFRWDIFAMGGDPAHSDADKRGRLQGDAFGSPDGLYFDTRGMLWVLTDIGPNALNTGDYARLGNNAMLAVDPATGEFKRFLVGPRGCEITGLTGTPDGRTFFVNIQHPGEGGRTSAESPRAVSNWPDFDPNGRPRSATVVIRKLDGGLIGT
jgi:hypothetical protein